MKRAPTLVATLILLLFAVLAIFIVSTSNKEILLRGSSVREGGLTLNAALVESSKDGALVESSKDGALVESRKDGALVETRKDGALVESRRDQDEGKNTVATNVSRWTTSHLRIEEKNATENPGCKAKTLHAYKALDVGKVYEYPSLVHFAKLGHSTMQLSFREYTSVMSVYKFLKPETIMFHTYGGLSGNYWDKISSWKDVKIEVNKIDPIQKIGGKYVSWIQHQADYVKLSMVYKHGGTALDFDVIIVNGTRLKREQSLSECVLAEESDYINGGFYSCVKNASFMADWLESYETDYRPHLWLHNISFRPLSLLTEKDRKKCYNVHLDDTICLSPSWSVNREWLKRNGVKWRTKTAAHYFVKNGIPNDGEGLLKENFSLAEMIQYVHNA